MSIDYALLGSLRAFEHEDLQIRETFLTPLVGGARTVAILSEPLGEPAAMGWVVCHPYGLEQLYVEPLEIELARALSALGFRVLRFHCQGYGDSELLDEKVTLTTHLRDTLDAVGLLRELGEGAIGLAGARFGGAVAAVAADRIGADGLILWEPIVDGSAYADSLIRQEVISALHMRALLDHASMFALVGKNGAAAAPNGKADGADARLRELAEGGQTELQGLVVQRDFVDEISALELTRDLGAFDGDSLVVQISRSATPRSELERLGAHLRSLGGSSTLETVVSVPGESPLGAPRFGAAGEGDSLKGDRQARLSEKLIEKTTAWARSLPR